ncbi:MAG: transcription antitermination factor NusB, partial [Pseudomonadota bacterium]
MKPEAPTPAQKRPPPQSRTGLTSTGVRKAASKSARSRAREFAVQALYQHLVGQGALESISEFTRDLAGFHKADSLHFESLLRGCVQDAADLDARLESRLDR